VASKTTALCNIVGSFPERHFLTSCRLGCAKGCYRQERLRRASFPVNPCQRRRPHQRVAHFSFKMPVSEQTTYNKYRSRLIRARAWRILSGTALLAIYLLLFAWNILNVRFI